MPVHPTYPGVYVEEIPSGVHTIAGVSTSVAAFLDFFSRGPVNEPVQIFNFGDFERVFGGLHRASEGSYAIQQFFLNGGSEAWVSRITDSAATTALVNIAAGGGTALAVQAKNPGVWGNALRVEVTTRGAAEFDLRVVEYAFVGTARRLLSEEVFPGLSMVATATNFVNTVINDEFTGSKLVDVTASGATRPGENGTRGGAVTLTGPNNEVTIPDPNLTCSINGGTAIALRLRNELGDLPAPSNVTLPRAAQYLEAALRRAALTNAPVAAQLSAATVTVIGNQLLVKLGLTDSASSAATITFANAGAPTTATALGLAAATAGPQEYVVGSTTAGANGGIPGTTEIIGSEAFQTGLFGFETVDLVNLLCLPMIMRQGVAATDRDAVVAAALAYCERRRIFFIVDTPFGIDEVPEARAFVSTLARHRNAALYYPRVEVPDPLNEFRLRDFGASGTMAGLYARTDGQRGVWVAPAGTESQLRNVSRLEDMLTDPENGALNPLAVNCLRYFRSAGNVSWGARTLVGNDDAASEWKYVPVRRLALYIEESLYRGTQWVIFKPNDEPLWAQIRLNVGAFMQSLFRLGAFQGASPKEAYLVKCDAETTTQNDIDRGIVNIVVGFAPLKPAEFVILKITQLVRKQDL